MGKEQVNPRETRCKKFDYAALGIEVANSLRRSGVIDRDTHTLIRLYSKGDLVKLGRGAVRSHVEKVRLFGSGNLAATINALS